VGGGKQWGAAEAAADSFVCAGAACCVQAYGVAVSGSYAYVVGANSDSLAIVDVSNKAAPTATLIGSLIDSTIMDGVRRCKHARQRPLYRARPAYCTRPGADGGAYGVAARSHAAAAWWAPLRLAAASPSYVASAFACAAMAHLVSGKVVGLARIVCLARRMCVHGLVRM